MASGGVPTFPAPAPNIIPISAAGQDDSDADLNVPEKSLTASTPRQQFINVAPAGRENDEELETLSIHEKLVDEAHARSADTARATVETPSLEPEVDL
jgi:hypothetical protein